MAERSGFFNALKTSTGYDIKYNADDYSENLAAIISNGVRRSGLNELRVTAAGGMALNIAIGRGWINGHWYTNDSVHNSFSVPTAPVGDLSRYDRVVLRLDKSISTRKIRLAYLQGTNASNPTPPALTRNETIYELSIATILVSPNTTTILQSDITDDRPDPDLCGWITTPIGYDDYFKNLDDAFNDWFQDKKDTLASVTMVKKYKQHITTTSATTIVEFNIPQYDPTGADILEVYVNGVMKVEGIHYSINSSGTTSLIFVDEINAQTDIDINVYKSLDGTGIKSVIDEITELQQQVATIKNIGEYLYICNGVNDNVKLSEIAQEFWNSAPEDATLTINVYGTFGASDPYSGSGTSVSRYRWFSLGTANATSTKRIIFDFLNCSQINLVNSHGGASEYFIAFDNTNFTIKNANIRMSKAGGAPDYNYIFSSTSGRLIVENCRLEIAGTVGGAIAYSGTFINCYGYVYGSGAAGTCFTPTANCLLRIENGEYYAVGSSASYLHAVVYIAASYSNACVITNGVNCPNYASYNQKYSFYCEAGYGAFNDTISQLSYVKSSNQNLRGYYSLSLANRG